MYSLFPPTTDVSTIVDFLRRHINYRYSFLSCRRIYHHLCTGSKSETKTQGLLNMGKLLSSLRKQPDMTSLNNDTPYETAAYHLRRQALPSNSFSNAGAVYRKDWSKKDKIPISESKQYRTQSSFTYELRYQITITQTQIKITNPIYTDKLKKKKKLSWF